jgi:hypothetical protein
LVLEGHVVVAAAQKEEQQRLREALKVLAEAEKQLRVASDQPTWLTAALLQFAPDRSFLPSSVNTSIAPSPAASNMSQRTTFLRQHARFEEESQTHHRRKMEEAPHHFGPALGRKFSAYLDHRKNNHNPSSIRLKTKVHPVSPLDNHTNLSEWKLEAAWAREVVHAETDDGYDDSFNPGSSCLLRMMDRQHLEKTWTRVLQICQSKVLRHLLQSDGKLIAVGIQDGTLSVFFLSKVAYLLSQAAASACFHGTHEENRKHVKGRVWLFAFISCPTAKLT